MRGRWGTLPQKPARITSQAEGLTNACHNAHNLPTLTATIFGIRTKIEALFFTPLSIDPFPRRIQSREPDQTRPPC